MHSLSYNEMAANIGKYFEQLPEGARVLDIGSLDVNGTYRALIEPRWEYIGVDVAPGRNVDYVMSSEFDTGLPESSADAVISGQCLEHCRNPFQLMAEVAKLAKPGAPILIVAPCAGWTQHRYPIDCWRFYPDGMRALFEQSGIECVENPYINIGRSPGTDCWGIGRKG